MLIAMVERRWPRGSPVAWPDHGHADPADRLGRRVEYYKEENGTCKRVVVDFHADGREDFRESEQLDEVRALSFQPAHWERGLARRLPASRGLAAGPLMVVFDARPHRG